MSDKNETTAATVESGQAPTDPNEAMRRQEQQPEDSAPLMIEAKMIEAKRIEAVAEASGCSVVGCYMTFGIVVISSYALSITSIVIGSIYIHDCPRERFIPIFLIVSGFELLTVFVFYYWYTKAEDNMTIVKKKAQKRLRKIIHRITIGIIFVWNIAGTVLVFSIHKDYQSDDPTGKDYCNDTCYKYAFWKVIAMMILKLCTAFFEDPWRNAKERRKIPPVS